MKKSHAIFFTGLIATILFMEYDLSRRAENRRMQKTDSSSVAVKTRVKVVRPVVVENEETPKLAFVEKFRTEAAHIAKIQNNPDEAQSRMNKLAQQMKPKDVESLFELISNDKANGDQRALAVELLSIKNDTTSLIALQNFVANNVNINGTKWDRKKEFETILRAQAVESIAAYPQKDIALSTLSYLQHKVDNTFLADRIGRATAQITLNARSLRQQDEEALKKLIE